MPSPAQPAPNPQYLPSTSTSAKDCVAATGAMLAEGATVTAVRTDHSAIRRASGAPATRGLYLWESAKGVKAVTGVELEVKLHVARSTVRDLVAGGSKCGVTIDTAVTRYTTRRTNYYVGPHEITLLDYQQWPAGEVCACEKATAATHAEFTVYDPGLTRTPARQWSAELVYRAAEKLTGLFNAINVLIAPDTEGVTWKATAVAAIRSEPSYSVGRKIGATVAGRTYAGGRTQNGGKYRRANGTYANGWIHIRVGDTWGWRKSTGMEHAA
jgi:hypothetical protein